MEPFRPIVDNTIIKAFNLGQIHEKDFSKNNNQYFIYGKKAAPYIQMLIKEILSWKDDIFLYIQQYYRCFMRGAPIEKFPLFYMEGEKHVISKL